MIRVVRRISRAEWVGVALLLAIAAALRLWGPDLAYLNVHSTRDFYRSQLMLRGMEVPLLGSELQFGGRTFGPLMYFLCAIPLAISPSAVSVAVFIGVLNVLLLGVVWVFVRSYFGRGIAFWTLAFYAVFPLEIAQLRFLWNPCFQPLMVTGAIIALYQVAVERRAWHLVTLVLFIGLGIQLHLSTAELFVSTGVILAVACVRIPWRVWAVAGLLLVVLFTPLFVNEAREERDDLAEVVKWSESYGPLKKPFRFNRSGIGNYFYHVRLQMYELGEDIGFAYLQIVPLTGRKWLGPGWMGVVRGINGFSQIQLVFWVAGVWLCCREVAGKGRGDRRGADRKKTLLLGSSPGAEGKRMGRAATAGRENATDNPAETPAEYARARRLMYLILLVWQAVPILILSLFNYHNAPGRFVLLAPIRYYLTTYPGPFITSAVGVMGLAGWAKSFGRGNGGRQRFLYPAVFAVAGLLVASHVVFDGLYLSVLGRSGRFLPYAWPNLSPNMRSMVTVRDILLEEARLDREAWFGRVHTQNLAARPFGEVSLDWLITQDPRSLTNSPPDPHLRWLLFSPFKEQDKPELPENASETQRWTVGTTGITVVEYRVGDPDAPIPDNNIMRNCYYAEENDFMRYLGPDTGLRAKAWEGVVRKTDREPRKGETPAEAKPASTRKKQSPGGADASGEGGGS